MPTESAVPSPSTRRRRGLVAVVAAVAALALAVPSFASALTFKIVNESGQPAGSVYVTVEGAPGEYDVPGMTNNAPVTLESIPNQTLTINQLVSGRIYVSYGAGVTSSVPFDSPTRFDWAELTVTPNSFDVANLTAVDQFGIGTRLDTFNAASQPLETVGEANSNTVFAAMQGIPGGPQATVRNSQGSILRVLSPNQTDAYPDLGDYVRSMGGQTIGLRTAFFGSPFTTSAYSGTFAADGSIQLSGTTNPPGGAPATINIGAAHLIGDIYSGGETPNNLAGAIYRDLLAGFSTGLWGGKYGNEALSFCSNPMTTGQGSWCPNGFNQPSFGDARASLSPYPTCEQYAAVINQYTDVYGNPYSDASKKVTVSLDQPGSGGEVDTLQWTILPDSGSAQPVTGGNSNCGAAGSGPAPGPGSKAAPRPAGSVKVSFFKEGKAHGAKVAVAGISCPSACGGVKAIAKQGQAIAGRAKATTSASTQLLKLRLTKVARQALAKDGRARVMLTVWVTPPGQPTVSSRKSVALTLRKPAA